MPYKYRDGHDQVDTGFPAGVTFDDESDPFIAATDPLHPDRPLQNVEERGMNNLGSRGNPMAAGDRGVRLHPYSPDFAAMQRGAPRPESQLQTNNGGRVIEAPSTANEKERMDPRKRCAIGLGIGLLSWAALSYFLFPLEKVVGFTITGMAGEVAYNLPKLRSGLWGCIPMSRKATAGLIVLAGLGIGAHEYLDSYRGAQANCNDRFGSLVLRGLNKHIYNNGLLVYGREWADSKNPTAVAVDVSSRMCLTDDPPPTPSAGPLPPSSINGTSPTPLPASSPAPTH